ncbi:MAG: response regulator [Blautia sp.]|nr:response regulator [Blautia sp.]
MLLAGNGEEAIRQIEEHAGTLSLVLLDLIMPVMSGIDVLRRLKETPEWEKIPVIVITSDHESEVESLELGAMDFIQKPYPSQNVILARIRRIIELSEDRQIIHSTERDTPTGPGSWQPLMRRTSCGRSAETVSSRSITRSS